MENVQVAGSASAHGLVTPAAAAPRLSARTIQVALGVIWLLDGLFQFKSFMYTHGIVSEVFAPAASGQPGFIGGPMRTFDNFYGSDLTLFNTLAGELQVAIGLGLMVSRNTVKPALIASFLWAPVVWWFGEGFGGLTSHTLPSPLMGAPGAVILYAIVGALVWPSEGHDGRSPAGSGALGERPGLVAWSLLWGLASALWLVNVNRARDATSEMIKSMAEVSPHWLAKLQDWAVRQTHGHGTTIAIALAIASALIAVSVWTPWRRPALIVAIGLSLAYWVFGQSIGGPFWVEGATDVNSGPLFVLLALTLYPVARRAGRARETAGCVEVALPPPRGYDRTWSSSRRW